MGLLFLAVMSLWFYAYFNLSYLKIILISVCINYTMSFLLVKCSKTSYKKWILGSDIICNLAILFYYKYFDFFIENINQLFKTEYHTLEILLPLGISFFTFQQISYIVDCYRDNDNFCAPIEYIAYVTFFPQLVAGPIVLHSELVPQLQDRKRKKIDYSYMAKGVYSFALGLAKKVLIADTLSLFVNQGYSQIKYYDSTNLLITSLCYTLQIYFDFSGYSDMAIGLGYLFHIDLPCNFHSPYKSATIGEFWKRWHMTLTRFFTQYVYIPMGGNRKGKIRTQINRFLVFLFSGIWHGANWTFILWGVLHGIAVIFDDCFEKYIKKIPKWITGALTFLFVNFTWIYFRASSIREANQFIRNIFTRGFGGISKDFIDILGQQTEMRIILNLVPDAGQEMFLLLFFAVMLVLLLLSVFLTKNTQEKVRVFTFSGRKMAVSLILLVWSILSFSGVSEFLYFNFYASFYGKEKREKMVSKIHSPVYTVAADSCSDHYRYGSVFPLSWPDCRNLLSAKRRTIYESGNCKEFSVQCCNCRNKYDEKF
ncbi:MAG: MBOAT family protein [Lachnospiraceae bacterium]|nr:MBOAT family protein [Lachnospiraceae bacterium]